jgi:hypothetical protein
MRSNTWKTALIAAAGLFAGTGTSFAIPITGTGDTSLAPALAGSTLIDFDAGPTGSFASYTSGNVTFTGVGAPLNVGPDFNGSFNTRGVNSLFNGFDLDPDAMRSDFAAPVSAFAFLWGAADNTWDLRAFDAANNLIESLAIGPVFSSNAGDYFGIAAGGIAYATLTDRLDNIGGGDFVFIDNFRYGGAVSVPEPSTLAVFGLGLLALGFGRRRAS